MLLIRNISNRDVDIPDLRISLKPGQTIDLDSISSRHIIGKSKNLINFVRNKVLVVENIDHGFASFTFDNKDNNINEKKEITIDDLKEMENRISTKIKRQEEIINSNKNDKKDNIDLSELQNIIGKLSEIVQSGSSVKSSGNTNNISNNDEEDIGLSEEELREIHIKAANKLSDKAKAKTIIDNNKISSDKNISKNIDELKNLM